jgi:hypothetical protein
MRTVVVGMMGRKEVIAAAKMNPEMTKPILTIAAMMMKKIAATMKKRMIVMTKKMMERMIREGIKLSSLQSVEISSL